jgi:predicted nucleic acid-binding protein
VAIRFTLDANILVYAVDSREPARQAASIDIIAYAARRDCALVPQALAEFFHATTRNRIMTRADAAREVLAWMTVFPLTPGPSATALRTALTEAEAGRFQFFDALLVATARDGGCRAVITEDMVGGASLDGVAIVGAFSGGWIGEAALELLR